MTPNAAALPRDSRLAGFADTPPDMGWPERLELIRRTFPSTTRLDWKAAFDADIGLFGAIVRDILKLEAATPGRSGPRPGLELGPGMESLRRMMGDDHALLPFAEAFKLLTRGRSVRSVVTKTGLRRTKVHRLMSGLDPPTVEEMTIIAKAFGKDPSWFVEYRTGYVVAHLEARLRNSPESSVGIYRKLAAAGSRR